MTTINFKKQLVILCGDIVLIAAAIYLAPVVRFQMLLDPLIVFNSSDIVAILIYILVFYIFDFYTFEDKIEKVKLVLQFALAILIINTINSSLFYIFHSRSYGSWILLFSSLFALVFLVLWRFAFLYVTGIFKNPLRVLILGTGSAGRTLYDAMKTYNNYNVVGFANDNEADQRLSLDGLPILGNCNNLRDLIKKYEIKKVIVALNESGEIKPAIFEELVYAKFNGVTVYEMPTLYEKITGKIPVLHTSHMWIGYSDISGITKSIYNPKLKKILDKTIASIFLFCTLPLLALLAVAIKLDSPGPIFYVQRRIGLRERTFNMVKFRSMRMGLENQREFAGQKSDPRITRIGKCMRCCRIDEIPQLWNVIKGEMSFIGPRALMVEEVNEFTPLIPYFSLRHSIPPGITGWAQINYRHGATVQDGLAKLEYDLYYVKNVSFLLDFHILLKTINVVLLGSGAR